MSGRHDDAGRALAEELRAFVGQAEFVRADVRHDDDVRNLIDQTVKRSVSASNVRFASPLKGPAAESRVVPSSLGRSSYWVLVMSLSFHQSS